MQVLLRFRLRGPKIVALSSNMTRYFPPSPRFFTSRRQNFATNSIVRQAAGSTKNACASIKFFEDIDFLGSSRFPGKGGLDFQEEPVCVSEPVGHSFDDLYADVDAFEQAGVHRESALARIPRVLFQAVPTRFDELVTVTIGAGLGECSGRTRCAQFKFRALWTVRA